MTDQNDKAKVAIKRLQAASDMSLSAYDQKLVICISGGKDSSVITDLVMQSVQVDEYGMTSSKASGTTPNMTI